MSEESRTDIPRPPPRRVLAIVLALVAAACLAFACFSKKWLYNPQNVEGDEVGFGLRAMFLCTHDHDCEDLSNPAFLEIWKQQVLEARFMAAPGSDAVKAIGDELEDLGGPALVAKLQLRRLEAAQRHPEGPAGAIEDAQLVLPAIKEVRQVSSAFVPFGWITLVGCMIAALSLAAAATLVLAHKRLVLPIMPTTTALLGMMVSLISGCVFVALKPGPAGYAGVGIGFFTFGIGVVLGLGSALMLNKLLRPNDPDLLEDAMNPDQF